MRRNLATPVLALALVLTLATACGQDTEAARPAAPPSNEAPPTTATPVRTPIQSDGRIIVDGTHSAWLSSTDDGVAVVELVEVLSGDEAVAAAQADGAVVEGENLPNDVFVRPLGELSFGLPISDLAAVQLYDCASEGCVLTTVALADLLDGSARPYGGDRPLVTIDVVEGQIVSIVEQYLP